MPEETLNQSSKTVVQAPITLNEGSFFEGQTTRNNDILKDIISTSQEKQKLTTILNFFGAWFKFLIKKEFTVKVSNQIKPDTGIHRRLDLLKEEVTGLGLKLLNISRVIKEIDIPQPLKEVTITNLPKDKEIQKVEITNHQEQKEVQKVEVTNYPSEKDVQKVEITNHKEDLRISNLEEINIPELPKDQKIHGDVTITNFPEAQKVTGLINVFDFAKLLEGVQVLVNAVDDLKLEMSAKLDRVSERASVGVATTGSHKEQIDGTTLFDPSDAQPTYIGKHTLPDASETDDGWEIVKFTYSGTSTTKIIRRKGVWADRASLF